jgi:hypothetical protein
MLARRDHGADRFRGDLREYAKPIGPDRTIRKSNWVLDWADGWNCAQG